MPSAAASFVTEMAMAHVPVLTQELLDLLDVQADSRVVDCTFGAGGHAEAVGGRLGPDGLLIACDQDPVAEEYYLALSRAVCAARPASIRAISPTAWRDLLRRGHAASPMSTWTWASAACRSTRRSEASRTATTLRSTCAWTRHCSVTAADILNTWTEAALAELFSRYGEERYSRRIARAIVNAPGADVPTPAPAELVDTIKACHPHAGPLRAPAIPRAGCSRPSHRGER